MDTPEIKQLAFNFADRDSAHEKGDVQFSRGNLRLVHCAPEPKREFAEVPSRKTAVITALQRARKLGW